MVASRSVSVEQHRSLAPAALGFAVVTVSDSRTTADDTSGQALRDLALGAGHRVEGSRLVPDDVAAIRAALREMLALPGVDVVVLTGGTGFSPRDVTLDAAGPLLEKPVEGFGELFRMLSYSQVGAAAMLSRAAAGLIGGQAVFLLPGSPKAVTLAMEKLILPEAGHLLGQARRSLEPPNQAKSQRT
ncbi:MAG TPA: molybdenum cofactor biosynthesis protein B [Thermoanaerobaculia bacterium]|nr:molybdenum cofactor biosynthesis protein B [Thermoanaerobaculia bacterium]